VPVPPEIDALVRGLDAADALDLDRRLRAALRLEARAMARVARHLTALAAWKGWRELGFRSLDAYAEERLGMSARRARGLLRVETAASGCPELRDAFASGRLSWAQAQTLLPLLMDPAAARHRAKWLAHARRVSFRRLSDDVERALATGDFPVPPLDPAGLQTGAIARSRAGSTETERLFFSAPRDVARLFRALLATAQRRIERVRGRPARTSDALEAMLEHALASWQPEKPTPRAFAVFERDGWRCTAPGCSSQRNLQQHHVVFRSRGGTDDPSNLTTLCAWHHLRGVHAGVLRCSGTAPHGLRFDLPFGSYSAGDVRIRS
jgi:hypothetical protein